MPQLQRFAPDTAPEKVVAALDGDGACIIEARAAPALMDAVSAELTPYIDATPYGRDSFTGARTTRTGALIARSPACRDLVMDEAILGACDIFLKRACDNYRVHLTQAIRIRPGQEKQVLHRDKLAWGGFIEGYEPQLNTIWAMTDFTVENGATQVVPGSPSWPKERRAEPHEICYAEMKRGDVLVYSGSVIHAGGANVSEADRIGLNLTYALGWLRQEENQYLSCPPHIARTLDPKLQALLGYAMGGYALGYFTPPLPPGEGPEACPPNVALGDDALGWGGEELRQAVVTRVTAKT